MAIKVGIFTESAIDVPKGLLRKKDIHTIPIHILINDKSRLHGIEVINQEVIEHIAQKDEVGTEPPTPFEYCSAYREIAEKYDRIYSMHTSSLLSKAYDNAQHGLKLYKKKQKSEGKGIVDIRIIDTRAASISLGQIANRVANIIKTDYDAAKLDKYIAWLVRNAMLFFVVDDMYWLKRAGKLNMFSSFFGKMFDIKPIIKLEKGRAVPVDKPRGKDTALDNLILILKENTPQFKRGVDVWIAHSSSLLDAKHTRKQLASVFKIKESRIPLVESGPTTTAHMGPGMVTVSMLPR